jgi:hypothetical protein
MYKSLPFFLFPFSSFLSSRFPFAYRILYTSTLQFAKTKSRALLIASRDPPHDLELDRGCRALSCPAAKPGESLLARQTVRALLFLIPLFSCFSLSP